MLPPEQQTVLECLQARRFLDSIPSLTIYSAIVIVHDHTLHLDANEPSVVDWVLNHLKLVKYVAWLTCGVQSITLLCYGEIVDEFPVRDILVGNADAIDTMTTATIEPIVETAPVSAPEPAPTPNIAATELYTLSELGQFAKKIGFDPKTIEDEIRAINPTAFVRRGEMLYELSVCDRAIQNVTADAIGRMRNIAAQPPMPAAQSPRASAKKKTVPGKTAKTTAK